MGKKLGKLIEGQHTHLAAKRTVFCKPLLPRLLTGEERNTAAIINLSSQTIPLHYSLSPAQGNHLSRKFSFPLNDFKLNLRNWLSGLQLRCLSSGVCAFAGYEPRAGRMTKACFALDAELSSPARRNRRPDSAKHTNPSDGKPTVTV